MGYGDGDLEDGEDEESEEEGNLSTIKLRKWSPKDWAESETLVFVSVLVESCWKGAITSTNRLVPSVMTSFDTPYILAVTMVAVLKMLLAKVIQKVMEA